MAICDVVDSTYQATLALIDDNEAHFLSDESEAGQRLHGGFGALRDGLVQVAGYCKPIRSIAPSFDFSTSVPGNGFRSLCHVCDLAMQHVFAMCSKVAGGRSSIVFRKKHFVREIEAWTQALCALSLLLQFTTDTLVPQCTAPDGDLITTHCVQKPLDLINMLTTVPLHSFYGRCLGFHYISSLQKTFQLLTISLSAYSEAYYSDGGVWSRTRHSIVASSQYIMSPEQRARRLVSVLQYASVDFIKSFWDLSETEIMRQLPSLVSPSLAVMQAISVPCEEQSVPHVSDPNRVVVVPPACSHIPPAPVTCYLLSRYWRRGMPGEQSAKASSVQEASPCLIIHCHGGGFVTQSTKAQEMFLREWASGTGCPMLSIDYSLSPAAPYPRPLEEVLMVYCWALNHLAMLGTTGDRIVLTGDSAGGSLVTAMTLRCLQLGIRPPSGLFLAYTPFMLKLLASPAKLLAIMDPMLPLSFALRCLKAYAGHSNLRSPTTSEIVKSSSKKRTISTTENTTSITNEDPTTCSDMNSERSSVFIDDDDGGDDPANHDQSPSSVEEGILLRVDDVALNHMSASKLCLLSPTVHSEAESDTLTTVSLTSDVSKIKRDEGKHKEDDIAGMDKLEKDDMCKEDYQGKQEDILGKEQRSRKYVAEFLEKYVMDTRPDSDGCGVPELQADCSMDTASDEGSGSTEPASSADLYSHHAAATRALSLTLGAAKDAVVTGLSAGLCSVGLGGRTTATDPKGAADLQQEPHTPSPVEGSTSECSRSVTSPDTLLSGACPSLLEEFVGVHIIDDPFINTLEAPHHLLQQFPRTSIMTLEFDFCLDDGVCMARLLRTLGVDVTLDVLPGLPHGFLNLCYLAPETKAGCRLAVSRIKALLEEPLVG